MTCWQRPAIVVIKQLERWNYSVFMCMLCVDWLLCKKESEYYTCQQIPSHHLALDGWSFGLVALSHPGLFTISPTSPPTSSSFPMLTRWDVDQKRCWCIHELLFLLWLDWHILGKGIPCTFCTYFVLWPTCPRSRHSVLSELNIADIRGGKKKTELQCTPTSFLRL